MERKKIAFFGECMIELSGSPLNKTFGGDTLNTALYLSRLLTNYPVDVSYATGIGNDSLSAELLSHWQHEGINCDLVSQLPGKSPGLYLVETDSDGERSFHYWRKDSAATHYFDKISPLEQAISLGEIDVFYLSGISLAILSEQSKARLLQCLKALKKQNKTIVFDNNYRAQLWSCEQAKDWYSQVLKYTDVALITEDDDILVWGSNDITERCQHFGCQQVVIKRGNEPCIIVSDLQSNAITESVSATKVENVVDTCAAGDSFAAGFIAGYLTQKTPTDSAKLGHALAGTVIQFSGAIIPQQQTDKFQRAGA